MWTVAYVNHVNGDNEWKRIVFSRAQLFKSILHDAIPSLLWSLISINTTLARLRPVPCRLRSTNMMDYVAAISPPPWRHSSRTPPPVFPWRRRQFSFKSAETRNKPDSPVYRMTSVFVGFNFVCVIEPCVYCDGWLSLSAHCRPAGIAPIVIA